MRAIRVSVASISPHPTQTQLRLSDETQQKYSKGKTLQDFTEITSAVQEQVAKEFGLGGDERSLREAVDAMRSAEVRFPEHRKAIINASHYRRFNRAGQSKYPAGSEVPELPLRSPAAPSSVKSLLELAMEEPSKVGQCLIPSIDLLRCKD